MNILLSRSPRLALLSVLAWCILPGCILVVDGSDDDDDLFNSLPYIVEDETYWACDIDNAVGDYFWEFQAGVGDSDGLSDIEQVVAEVVLVDTGELVEAVNLIDEGAGIWGGLIWEEESSLYCGDPVDVTFIVYDWAGDSSSYTLYY